MPLGPGKVTGYVEADFLDRPPAEAFRFRQYYGQYSIGDWEFSAGQEWSLLRPNRQGVASDRALMNTRVVDPAYHVGLMGVRNRQVRVTRHFGNWHAVAAFEEGDDFTAKLAQDGKRLHWELIGIGGREGRYGGSVAAVVHVLPSIDWVSQQSWVREGGRQALSTVPNEAPATSTIQGIEAKVTEKWQLFGYGGLVYGGRSSGNRIVYEWSAGFSRETWENRVGHMVLAGQYSKLGGRYGAAPHGGSHFVSFRCGSILAGRGSDSRIRGAGPRPAAACSGRPGGGGLRSRRSPRGCPTWLCCFGHSGHCGVGGGGVGPGDEAGAEGRQIGVRG